MAGFVRIRHGRISSQPQFRSDNPEYSGPPRQHVPTVMPHLENRQDRLKNEK